MEFIIAIVILDAIICGVLASDIAAKKGHSSAAWGACGFFFGILGLIAAAGLPKKEDIYSRHEVLTKVCPTCAETIKLEAQICKYCGKLFDKEEIISRLEKLLNSPLVYNHEIAVALLNIGTIPALIAVLKKAALSERLTAISALVRAQDQSAILALVGSLEDKSIRKEVTSALVKIGKPALPFLEEEIRVKGESIRKYAEKIIEEIKTCT